MSKFAGKSITPQIIHCSIILASTINLRAQLIINLNRDGPNLTPPNLKLTTINHLETTIYTFSALDNFSKFNNRD